jgi:hypothetical protein
VKLASAKTVGKSLNGKRRKKPEILAVAKLDRPPLTLQVLWGCRVYNSTPEEAAQTAVTDLLEYLSQGGVVQVQVAEEGGPEYILEVSARVYVEPPPDPRKK